MKNRILAISIIAIFLFPGTACSITCSEYFKSAKDINVSVGAVAEETINGFNYNYMLSSSKKSSQDVWSFMIEHQSPLTNTLSPEGWSGMGTGITGGSPYSWSSDEADDFNIKPGGSLSGFSLQSAGLPGIVTFYAHGWVDLPTITEEEMPGEDEEDCPERNIFINAFKTKTIGPTAPPEELVPADFLRNLIEMKHEATKQGWITNTGVERSLDAKLDAALKNVQSGNTKAAGNILGAFINEVEAQGCETYDDCPKGKHLTPEAYALLKYNAQYLIDNLK
jgi:hypothetical protein